MDKKMYGKNIKVKYSEMDYDLMLKPASLLHFLQDSASDNAQELCFGYSNTIKNKIAWYLLKYHMEFSDYPKNIYDLKILTEPRGYNKLFAFRDFELHDNQKLLGRITSTWSLIDMQTKNIIPVAQVFGDNPNMKPFEKREDDLCYQKIHPIENIDIEKVYEIRFDDIDVNKHANNANYIIWAFEPLDFDFRCQKKLKMLDMVYKKEVKYGTKILSQVEIKEDKTVHILKSFDTKEDLCHIQAYWVNK